MRNQIEAAIQSFTDPHLHLDYVSAGAVKAIDIEPIETDKSRVSIAIETGFPLGGLRAEIEQAITEKVLLVDGVGQVDVSINWQVKPAITREGLGALAGVKNIIAVASGKGGVGKSTTAANLALALSAEGANVGILDADIYGPSQSLMLGVEEGVRPQVKDEKYWIPVQAHGIQAMSMGFLVDERTPMVWRGPMATGALQQLLTQTLWQDLDYLIIDMPPGTGDIQLTLSQKVPVAGAVIVTTPQDIALLDAKKGIEMFAKVKVPVLGVVENMSVHICSQCGHAEHVFGEGGGERISELYQTPLLGSLPLELSIRQQVDGGRPTVIDEPDGAIAGLYRSMARNVAAELSLLVKSSPVMPSIEIAQD